MKIGVISEDLFFCHQLAAMCFENKLQIIFINIHDKIIEDLKIVIIDLESNMDEHIEYCKHYHNSKIIIFGAIVSLKKSITLKAKDAGCLVVLPKSNFPSNILDIINKNL
tara:strand:+ start:29 stop:358 length:330 start_codon:yes stop_codon:yes gene_type:complete